MPTTAEDLERRIQASGAQLAGGQAQPLSPAQREIAQQPISDEPGPIGDVVVGTVAGVRDATQNALDLTERGGRFLEKHLPLGAIKFDENGISIVNGPGGGINLPETRQPKTVAGRFAKPVAQFLTGFLPVFGAVSRLTGAAGALGTFASAEVSSVIAEQFVFDPADPRFANFIRDLNIEKPEAVEAIADYLAADPNDTEAEARFKLGLEGTGLGLLTGAPFLLFKGFQRGARARRKAAGGDEATQEALEGETRAAPPDPILVDAQGNIRPLPTRGQDARLPELAPGVNISKIDANTPVKEFIIDAAEKLKATGQLDEQTRGRLSIQALNILADELNIPIPRLLDRNPGVAANAEELIVRARTLVSSAESLQAKSALHRRGAVSDSDYMEALSKHMRIQSTFSGARAEAGRALRVLRELQSSTAADIEKVVAEFGLSRENLSDVSDMISSFRTTQQANLFTGQIAKVKKFDQFFEAWINGLLSGPKTHAVNIGSNMFNSLLNIGETQLAGVFGLISRDPDRVRLGEAGAQLYGLLRGLRKAGRLARQSFAAEAPLGGASKLDVPRIKAIQGTKGKVIRLPGRLLLAEDAFFQTFNRSGHISRIAYRQAREEGLNPAERDFWLRVREIEDNPTDKMLEAAKLRGEYLTFTNKPGAFGQTILSAARRHPVLRLIAPFIRTPANLLSFAAERNPVLAPLMRRVRNDLRGKNGAQAQQEMLARYTMSLGVGSFVMEKMLSGEMTGSGPTNPRLREEWLSKGFKPYHVKIGDEWYGFQRLEPFGFSMGVLADTFVGYAASQNENPDDWLAAMATGVAGVMQNMTSKTYLTGITEFAEFAGDPLQFGDWYARRLVSSTVPALVREIERQEDPVLREGRGFEGFDNTPFEKLKSLIGTMFESIPGYSSTLPINYDVLGRPIIPGGAHGPDFLSPIYRADVQEHALLDKALELEVNIPSAPLSIRGVRLSQRQHSDLQRVVGQEIDKNVTPFAEAITKRGEKIPKGIQRSQLERLINQVRTEAIERWTAQHPELEIEAELGKPAELLEGTKAGDRLDRLIDELDKRSE